LSLHRLAEVLDNLAETGAAVISESQVSAAVFGLSAVGAKLVADNSHVAALNFAIADAEGTAYHTDDLIESFAPYTVTIEKPVCGGLSFLTNTAFSESLGQDRDEPIWHVARLRNAIVTSGRIFLPWGSTQSFAPGPSMKNPRTIVKESSATRIVISDIRPWILRSDLASLTCASSYVWVRACIDVCLKCLPDEVDATSKELRFKGPPRRTVHFYPRSQDIRGDFPSFQDLQNAVSWIYELENQCEVRHLYFKAEVVRSGLPTRVSAAEFLQVVESALEGAKIAYAMSISELGKDTVKALADLKKSITEDTAKLTEATRQLIAAVATALAVGIGLLAARVASVAPINLIGGIMLVVALYVGLIILTGWSLVRLQGQLRKDWHPKIYRFLTDAEYNIMVEVPARTAEMAFTICSVIGGFIVLCLTGYIIKLWVVS